MKVELLPDPADVLLVFKLDQGRKGLRRGSGQTRYEGKLCDGLFFFRKVGQKKILLCLVELKGKDLVHGAFQIKETFAKLRYLAGGECVCGAKPDFKWAAFIATSRSEHEENKEALKVLSAHFPGPYEIGRPQEFDGWLRGLYSRL